MIKLDSSHGHKNDSTYKNQSVRYTTSTKEKTKATWFSPQMQKKNVKEPNSHQYVFRGNISQHNEGHLQQTHSQTSSPMVNS